MAGAWGPGCRWAWGRRRRRGVRTWVAGEVEEEGSVKGRGWKEEEEEGRERGRGRRGPEGEGTWKKNIFHFCVYSEF